MQIYRWRHFLAQHWMEKLINALSPERNEKIRKQKHALVLVTSDAFAVEPRAWECPVNIGLDVGLAL